MHIKLLFSFLSLLLIPGIAVMGQDSNVKYKIQRFDMSDGMCGNKVIDICQDAFGRMWFGTTSGVSRYDGASFTNFSRNSHGNFRLSHNQAQVLLALDNGDVWIGTPDSLNIYEYGSDRIIRPGEKDGLLYTDITSLCKGRDGNSVWIGTYGNGIVKYDCQTKKFDSVNYSETYPGGYITAIMEDSNEFLWIGTRYEGLFRTDLRTGKCTRILQNCRSYVHDIFQDRAGNIWAGTDDGLFYVIGDITEKVRDSKTGNSPIVCITETPDGRIWIGGSNVFLKFPAGETIRGNCPDVIEIEEGPLQSQVSYKSIHSIYCDTEGNIWAGSYGGGVNLISSPDPIISQIYPGSEQNGLNGSINKTMAIEAGKDGILWFGMDGSGLVKYDRASKSKQHFRINGDSDDIILSVLADRKGNIWTGSYTHGLSVMDRYGKITHFPADLTGFSVRSIFESRRGDIYFGSEKGLLTVGKSGTISNTPVKHDVRAMQEDSLGRLWLATYGNGVAWYDPDTEETCTIGKYEGLNSLTVFDITITEEGKIWCATDYGIDAMDMDGNVLGLPESLDDMSCVSITHDKDGNIWAASGDILKIEKGSHEIKHYLTESISSFGDFSEGAICTTDDGRIFFGGFNGTISIDSNAEVPADKGISPIIFTDLKIFDQPVMTSSEKRSTLQKNINLQEKIILKPKQNVFSIDFVSPEYLEQPVYEYFLKGIDNDWNELGTVNSITFRNLPAKKYELHVRSHFAGSGIYSSGAIRITVKPFWYNTAAAKTGLVLLVLSVLVLVYTYYASKLKFSYTLALEKDKRLKEEELHDAKLTFFTNISHELRTPLTLLIAPLEQLIDNETNSSKLNNLKIINKNANRLLSLINQILDFRKTEKGQMQIKVKEIYIEEYVDDIVKSFTELANERRITFTSEILNPEKKRIWADPSIIDKICLNLLSNAFKFTEERGTIHIGITVTHTELQIRISDSGKGISKDVQEKVFERFWQENRNMDSFSYKTAGSGIGLHLVKSLTELHHGTITLKSEVDKGSEFTVILPCVKDEYALSEIDNAPSESTFLAPDEGKDELPVPAQSNKPVIVICDDNNEILDYLCEALGSQYNIKKCTDGEQALETVRKSAETDMVVCDIMMPGINGLDVCKEIKSNFETNHIPVILLTAKSGMDDMLEGLECGADAYISKPFKLSHLKVQIRQILESRETLRQKYQKSISFEAGGFESAGNEEDKFIKELNRCILARISDAELNGEILSRDMNLSRSSLHRKLKALTGLSTGDYIKNLRLGKAAEMLVESDMTISEICYMTGFSAPPYFTSCFKAQYRLSPKEYRAEYSRQKDRNNSAE